MQMIDFTGLLDVRILGGAAILAVVGLYAYVVLRKYVHVVIENMENHALVPDNGFGEVEIPDGDEVRFATGDGLSLCGTLMRASPDTRANHERGAVIFAHEFGSDRSIAERYCRPLVRYGFDVLAFDFRGHGSSARNRGYQPRQWPSDRETSDLSGAIEFLRDEMIRQGRPVRIALFGLSRGASTAILAASQHKEVCAIVSDGAYSSDIVTEFFMRRFAPIFAKMTFVAKKHPPLFWRIMRIFVFREYERRSGCTFPFVRKALAKMGRMPILFIHGEKDSYIPLAHCQMLYDLAFGPKCLWVAPEARHNQCVKVDPEGYFGQITRFLDEHLSTKRVESHSTPRRSRRYEYPVSVPATTYAPVLVPPQREPTATAV